MPSMPKRNDLVSSGSIVPSPAVGWIDAFAALVTLIGVIILVLDLLPVPAVIIAFVLMVVTVSRQLLTLLRFIRPSFKSASGMARFTDRIETFVRAMEKKSKTGRRIARILWRA